MSESGSEREPAVLRGQGPAACFQCLRALKVRKVSCGGLQPGRWGLHDHPALDTRRLRAALYTPSTRLMWSQPVQLQPRGPAIPPPRVP